MARPRCKGSKPSTTQTAAAPSSRKPKGGRPRPASKAASGGGKPGGRPSGGSKPAQLAGAAHRIVEFAPPPGPATLAERFALLEKQRQQLGAGRQRAAAPALGVASGGVAKKAKQQQRRRKGKVGCWHGEALVSTLKAENELLWRRTLFGEQRPVCRL